jgi:hypothetical protein
MCRSTIKFSRLVNIVSIVNSDPRVDKNSKLIEIVSQLCHEKLENKFRVKTINDLLKKQKLRSSAFVMYVNLHYDAKKDLIIIDYPFYPRSTH